MTDHLSHERVSSWAQDGWVDSFRGEGMDEGAQKAIQKLKKSAEKKKKKSAKKWKKKAKKKK